jgi:poly-gamma-glutamate capsule biosynthesis protein CapA/YwtB (metallophosphatase superfamily)
VVLDASWSRSHPWFAGFVISVISVVAAVAAVGVAFVTGDDGGAGAGPDATATPDSTQAATGSPTPTSNSLTYAGVLPAALVDLDLGLEQAPEGEVPDLRFVAADPGGVIVDVGVLVTDPAMGVWDVTGEQAERLARGEIASWSEVGGRDLPLVVGIIGTGTSAAAQTQSFDDYAGLREALVSGSGILALVPMSEVRSPMAAIAIDGLNPIAGDAPGEAWPFLTRVGVQGETDRGRAAVPGLVERIAWQPVNAVRVVGTGDIIPVRCSLGAIEATGDYGAPFRGEVGAFLREADLVLGSWDLSLQDFSEAYRCVSTVNLTAPEAAVEVLIAGGVDGVTVATNHVFDCGVIAFCGADAFLNTLEVLAENGVVAIGGGADLAEAQAAHIFEAGGIRFGVLSFDDVAAMDLGAAVDSPGTSPLDDDYTNERALGGAAFFAPAELLDLSRFEALIAELVPQVDFVIVQLNSGTEDTHTPSPRSLKAARAALAAGADIVFGNQAHHVQASESIGDQFIIYAMGNFIYDQIHTPEHTHSVLTEVVFWPDRMAAVRLVPVAIRDYYLPEFSEGDEAANILGDVSTAAQALR